MFEMFTEYLLFFAKTATLVVAILIVLTGIIALSTKQKKQGEHIAVKKLNDHFDELQNTLQGELLSKKEWKAALKEKKAKDKSGKSDDTSPRKKIFVLAFEGDIRASSIHTLREEITAVLTTATPEDEVMINLESPGGLVHAYGLAASQLARIRAHNIPLTVCVDKVAASGGYMMACIANRIIAAPFAILGSIGVLAQLPNFHRLLEKHDIDFEQHTAGEYKRTLTMFGDITSKDREKFQEEIEETHQLFKAFVHEHRPRLDIDKVATGEHWYGTQAKALDLIDEINTSDDYLFAASRTADLYQVTYQAKKNLSEKLFSAFQTTVENLVTRAAHFTGFKLAKK